MSEVILDASALLAVLRRERGCDVVEAVLTGATVSAVNYSEVVKKSVEAGGQARETRVLLRLMALVVAPFDESQAFEAGALFSRTEVSGLSFADRACLALGLLRKWPVLTTDRRFAEVGLPVEVRVIRRAGSVH